MKNKKNFKLFGLFILLSLITIGCSGCALDDTESNGSGSGNQSKLDEICIYQGTTDEGGRKCIINDKGKVKTFDKKTPYISYIKSNSKEKKVDFPYGILTIKHGKKVAESNNDKKMTKYKICFYDANGNAINNDDDCKIKNFDKENHYLSYIDSDGYENEVLYLSGSAEVEKE